MWENVSANKSKREREKGTCRCSLPDSFGFGFDYFFSLNDMHANPFQKWWNLFFFRRRIYSVWSICIRNNRRWKTTIEKICIWYLLLKWCYREKVEWVMKVQHPNCHLAVLIILASSFVLLNFFCRLFFVFYSFCMEKIPIDLSDFNESMNKNDYFVAWPPYSECVCMCLFEMRAAKINDLSKVRRNITALLYFHCPSCAI